MVTNQADNVRPCVAYRYQTSRSKPINTQLPVPFRLSYLNWEKNCQTYPVVKALLAALGDGMCRPSKLVQVRQAS